MTDTPVFVDVRPTAALAAPPTCHPRRYSPSTTSDFSRGAVTAPFVFDRTRRIRYSPVRSVNMNNPFFRIPDWRMQLAIPPTELFVDGPAIPFRMKLAPPRAAIDAARAMTPSTSMLWIPSRIARPEDIVAENGVVVSNDEDAWVFFCDDVPGAPFSHRCRYFLISDGENIMRVVDANAAPREGDGDVGYIEDRPSRRILFI